MRFQIFEHIDRRRVSRRRAAFFTSVFVLTSIATWFMADLLWEVGGVGIQGLEWSLLTLFVILFAQIAVGFVIAMTGYFVVNRSGCEDRITQTIAPDEPLKLAGTAIVMPVFNEDVSRVFEGLRAIYRSVQETGHLEHFDFFILSDSNQPNQWVQEEVAWLELCKQVGGFGKIFYRKRRQQINKKSGNVADFLRRWGAKYRYMVVLDADSIMTGDAIVRLTAMMEKHPQVGLIQTAPRLVRGETLFARLQQFSNRLYSGVFLAGINHWQQHEANYWGHNAIIRVQPFMEHCALPDLPGSEPYGGRILSHDFVEAALMRRAGHAVWLAYDIEGTYEEGPPTPIDSAKRDRRWCQGNMQHAWLLAAGGFRPVNRMHLLMGVMAYLSSPIWLLFLVLSTLYAFDLAGHPAVEVWSSTTLGMPKAFTLFVFTLVILFLPKIVGLLSVLQDRERSAQFGGRLNATLGALLETLVSALLAPINMLFNSKFVVFILLGQGVSWVTQRRDVEGNDWREPIITHSGQTVFGLIWGISTFIILPGFFLWLSPVVAGLVLSIPLSIMLSSRQLGLAARRMGLLITPEESTPPRVLSKLEQSLASCHEHIQPFEPLRKDYGLLQAVLDPYINALHVSLLRQRKPSGSSREWLGQLRRRLLVEGPVNMTTKEKMALLLDAESMIRLHQELWRQPGTELSDWWRLAVRQYNVLITTPVTALYR